MKTEPVPLPDRPEFRDTASWALAEARRITLGLLAGTGVRAILYGSRARGEGRSFSDIDLALSAGDRAVPGSLIARLSEAFEESRIPFRVDLLDLFSASPALKEAITREGIPWTG
jgi:predicted nucleotidyltransferase